jgi:hypothetical protein
LFRWDKGQGARGKKEEQLDNGTTGQQDRRTAEN